MSAHALAAGAMVNGAGRYHVDGAGPGALILGYGQLDDDGVRDGVQILRDAIRAARM